MYRTKRTKGRKSYHKGRRSRRIKGARIDRGGIRL